MKQLLRACCIGFLALSAAACQSVSELDSRVQGLELGADTYIVRPGESIESVAFRYRLTPSELAALNPGVGSVIPAGSRLNVRMPEQNATRSPGHSFSAPRVNRTAAAQTSSRVTKPAVSQPAYRPRAVPTAEVGNTDRTIYAPREVSGNDAVLLGSAKPATDQVMRNGVMEPITYARREIVEEEYIHGTDTPLSSRSSTVRRQDAAGNWTWPTDGQIARSFAPDTEDRHGVDIAGLPGQPIVAVLDGTVAYSGKDPSGAGNLVIIRHRDNLLTAYSHTRDLYVAEDDTVRAGDPIATLGANREQEAVLRFEVRRDGNSLNPMEFLSAR